VNNPSVLAHSKNSRRRVMNRFALGVVAALTVFAFAPPQAGALTKAQALAKKKKHAVSRKHPLAAPARARVASKGTDVEREKMALPTSQALRAPVATRSLGEVKPPRSNDFYEANNKEAEYEHLVDEEIRALYNLSQQNKRSPNRGEIWLRLGERYVEKARLVGFREQSAYDVQMKSFMDKKSRVRPKMDAHLSRDYNKKAIELYQWFVQDFPKDPKVDQALFFLGYNQFELGNPDAGEKYYIQLLHQFPDSSYVTESRFALGEYYFENEQWQKALDNYAKVIESKRARLNSFALYKAAWCYYRLGRASAGLKALDRVIRLSRAGDANDSSVSGGGKRAVNKVRLASEALKDYVPFYAEVGDPRRAASEFERISGDEKTANQMLERLAYIYADAGNRVSANSIFKQLISMNPNGERAAEYQYQVVLAYATSDPKSFRYELEIWLNQFGPDSDWAKANQKNAKLTGDVAKLQETTLRNNVLQLHQTAQNSRIQSAQKAAAAAYAQYFRYFPKTEKTIEMRFFYAELLYDMDRFEDASKLYAYVADHDETGKYKERAIVNTLLALEKDLPSSADIEAKRGKSIEPIPLDPPVQRFEKAALKYADAFPKSAKASDVLRRLGVLYYSYNQFDKAIDVFQRILRDYPKSPNAEIAGNLILDIYKLKGDMIGLADKGQEMLKNPSIANSKFGITIRGMMEKASFMKADKLAEKGDPAGAAKQYEQFATTYKASDLAAAARFKAAAAYEKSGDLVSAMRMHSMVLAADSTDPKVHDIQNDSRNALSHIYQQTGQLELAAKSYHDYAAQNLKDPKAVNGFFNAGVLYDSLGSYNEALSSYDTYFAKSKNADRTEVLYLDAQIWKKRGNQARAAAFFDRYIREGGRNQAHIVEATYEMAKNAKRLGQVTKQKELWQEVISRYKRSGAAKEATVAYAAEATFELAQPILHDLASVRFYHSAKQQATAANDVKLYREKYVNAMKQVILFDNAKWIVAALASSGQMFDSIAKKFDAIPNPQGFSPDDLKKYRDLINQQSAGFRSEAKNSYKTAVDRSQELESYTEWTQIARAGLSSLDPSAKSKDAGEVAADAQSTDWMGL
jgi:TolA-binding protein